MRAVLINPYLIADVMAGDKCRHDIVKEVDYTGNFKDIYSHLSVAGGREVDDFNLVHISYRNDLFVDGEGLLHEPTHFLITKFYPEPLAGPGLILGTDEDGDSIDADVTLDWVRENFMVVDMTSDTLMHLQ